MSKKVVIIGVNERGNRVGDSHHNARIPQDIVDRLRDLHEDSGIGYRRLAQMFGLSLTAVKKICKYERRAQIPERYKRMVIYDEEDYQDQEDGAAR